VATARERLLQALTAIISQPFSEEGKIALGRLLNSYRVQCKPGENFDKTQTARNQLAIKITEAWKVKNIDQKFLNKIISTFRMQLKQGLSRGKHFESNKYLNKELGDPYGQGKTLSRLQIKENTAKHENAYFKDKHKTDQDIAKNAPIAGGPKQSPNIRGQCPKCRSMGIVLARAYGGEDYHSCIYCGYQAYLKGRDPKLDLPLAAELLDGVFIDPEVDDEES
jgi:hypothetical protein